MIVSDTEILNWLIERNAPLLASIAWGSPAACKSESRNIRELVTLAMTDPDLREAHRLNDPIAAKEAADFRAGNLAGEPASDWKQ